MSRIRALVVDDSFSVRKHLVEVLRSDPAFEVVGEAANGEQAIQACKRLRPDVMTLDMVMPRGNGLEVTEVVMAEAPTPILIVSASFNPGEMLSTYDALAAGAVDVIRKPNLNEPLQVWNQRFIAAVRMVARIKVITHLRHYRRTAARPPQKPGPTVRSAVVGLGASTGGPAALKRVLGDLKLPRTSPILVVLHISSPFDSAFAEWLSGELKNPVRFAKDGESLQATAGQIILAPGDRHLEVHGNQLRLADTETRNSCKPSIDVLFRSMAEHVGDKSICCLLTGMGVDGAHGLLQVRQSGGVTISQNEESCVVYGMPREAVAIGASEFVLPLCDIASAVAERLA